jgi:hypothetical protein
MHCVESVLLFTGVFIRMKRGLVMLAIITR